MRPKRTLTRVAVVCDSALRSGAPDLALLVQEFVLPLSVFGPAFARRVGGRRLLRLWLLAATRAAVPIVEYTFPAVYEALKEFGDAFLDRAMQTIHEDSMLWAGVVHDAVRNDARRVLELVALRMPFVKAPLSLQIAAERGNIALLTWLQERQFGGSITRGTLGLAASSGSLETIQWLLTSENRHTQVLEHFLTYALSDAMKAAARCGHFHIVKWLEARKPANRWTTYPVLEALLNGHEEIAAFLMSRYEAALTQGIDLVHKISPYDLQQAFRQIIPAGDLPKLRWLHDHGFVVSALSGENIDDAMEHGQVDILQFLEDHVPSVLCNMKPFGRQHARGGSIEAATWAAARGKLRKSIECIYGAAEKGHMAFVRWYMAEVDPDDRKYVADSTVLATTVRYGHLESVQFLVERGWVDVVGEHFVAAAAYGHVAVLEWLSNYRHCAFSMRIAAMQAAAGGHLDVIQWLYARGGSHTSTCIVRAAAMGHAHVVEWLLINESPTRDELDAAVFEAVKAGRLRIVRMIPWSVDCKPVELARLARDNWHPHVGKWIETFR